MNSPAVAVRIPLLNPNEPEAYLASLAVSEGQRLGKGEIICTLETTKSNAELAAEEDGYVVGLRIDQGQLARAGEILCYLAPSADWTPPEEQTAPKSSSPDPDVPEGLRITQPALELARRSRLELSRLPTGSLVTESVVRAELEKGTNEPGFSAPALPFDPTSILIYGGGGHGKMVIDLLRALGLYQILGIIDDRRIPGETLMGLPVLGGGDRLSVVYAQGTRLAANAVGGIGNIAPRVKVFQQLAAAGFSFPFLIHPTAYVEASARLSPGVQVMAHAYVGSEAQVGFGDIINTGAIVSHDCILGDYVNISPGALLAGEVQVGAGALIGMGVTVNLQVRVGAGARIGNGATVKADVPDNGIVRAGTIWPS
jgi:acetyltransferase EpsM